ncbi:hypothetical protein K8352_06470 [Flavobacteriaceae bacterium F89]|uniref:Uncharacterized protein n=1 Tax=Cerina litoralis TaxID=2874477 RepID=A0AAE3ESP9_9FLAO|nr:hypothetical protein [Cerina litoralis]MCG2460385.1 hypothetical protein [Cerina litoralis]
MGKTSTGVMSTSQCRKLDLGFMLKNGWIKKGCAMKGQMSWTGENTAEIETVYTDIEKYVRMVYTITDRQGAVTNYDYKIELVTVPSNLGKGEILYLLCPETSIRARILYSAYGYGKYVHRNWYLEQYGKRLYYNTQLCTKYEYHNTRYHTLDRKINDLIDKLFNSKHRKMHYKGKPTKDQQRLFLLESKRLHYDNKRNRVLIKKLGITI